MGCKFVWRTGMRFKRVFARHLDVAAQGQGTDAVIGIAFAEAQHTLTKAERKDVYPNTTEFGGGVVAELVDQDQDSQEHDEPENIPQPRCQNRFHKPRLCCWLFVLARRKVGCRADPTSALSHQMSGTTPCVGVHIKYLFNRFGFVRRRFTNYRLYCGRNVLKSEDAIQEGPPRHLVGRVEGNGLRPSLFDCLVGQT